ncbi:hypothetical protein ACXYMX_00545 [Sporosarcina sp. CAU 1771]
MKKKKAVERKDVVLRQMYESGELDPEEFLEKLFSTKEADRKRRSIVEKNEKYSRHLQEA